MTNCLFAAQTVCTVDCVLLFLLWECLVHNQQLICSFSHLSPLFMREVEVMKTFFEQQTSHLAKWSDRFLLAAGNNIFWVCGHRTFVWKSDEPYWKQYSSLIVTNHIPLKICSFLFFFKTVFIWVTQWVKLLFPT